jgi:hypothetical protein
MQHKSYRFDNIGYEQLIHDFEINFHPDLKFSNNQNTTKVYILEDYYFRINSTLTVTVIISKKTSNSVELHIVASGGKEGIFGFSYGAEKSALKKIIKFAENYNPLR